MQNYSQLISEHFLNPRNVGDIKEPAFVGQAGSISCGAIVRVSMSIDDSQRIVDAKFKAAGCSFLVASASILTERIKRLSTGDAAARSRTPQEAFGEALDQFPTERIGCVGLACQAVVSAIKEFSDAARDEWNGDDALICTCFCVSEKTIEREIITGGLETIAQVIDACNAGAGCRSCHPLIDDILQEQRKVVRGFV